jgi:hypothetical protein
MVAFPRASKMARASGEIKTEAAATKAATLTALPGEIGLVLGLYGKYHSVIGWHGEEQKRLTFLPPGDAGFRQRLRQLGQMNVCFQNGGF